MIGGDVTDMGTGAQWTGGEWFVVEADESDGTHLELPLFGTIVTNIDIDHLDHYGSLRGITDAFDRYLGQIGGPKVVCGDDAALVRLAADHDAVTYGLGQHVDVRGVDLHPVAGSFRFGVERGGNRVADILLPMRGIHNVVNALGALALAMEVGVDADVAARALARFGGVARRFDIRAVGNGITFVDDYAHLPTEIDAVLAAARHSGDGWRRVIAVFQPNRYNRIAEMWDEYHSAFVDADLVVLTDVYPSGTVPIPGVTGKLLVNAVSRRPPSDAVSCGCRGATTSSPTWPSQVRRGRRLHLDGMRRHRVASRRGDGDTQWSRAVKPATHTTSATADAVEHAARCSATRRAAMLPLAPMTTYRVGGTCGVVRLGRAASTISVAVARRPRRDRDCPCCVVGRGSNMLVADAGFGGIAISVAACADDIEIGDTDGAAEIDVVAGGGVALPVLARRTAASGVTGFEWAVGVPGSIGGAVKMNAGGHGSDMAACVRSVEILDLAATRPQVERCGRDRPRPGLSELCAHR